MPLSVGDEANFERLRKAMLNGDVAFLECQLISTRKSAAILCAVNREADRSFAFVPIAQLFPGDPYDTGRRRKDHGVRHEVSGLWHATTITNIARNHLLIGMTSYGQRSMGDQRRHSPDGPRELEPEDWRLDQKPKVVRNPESHIIRAKANFEPLTDPEKLAALT